MMTALKWIGIIAAAIVAARLIALIAGFLFTMCMVVGIALVTAITGVRYEGA